MAAALAAVGAGVVLVAPATPAVATGGTLFVAQGGVDTGTCTLPTSPCATVTYALTQASAGATVEVTGTVVDHVDVTVPVTITGAGAPASSPAVLDGATAGQQVVRDEAGVALSLDHLTVEGSFEFGGILNLGTTTVTDSTITGNFQGACFPAGNGGGISNKGTLTVIDSTITGNNSNCGAGGLSNDSGTTTVVASTISGNGNHGEGGVGGAVTIGASIVSGNNGPNCLGTLTSTGYNLSDDTAGANTCGFTQPTDHVGAGLQLGPLADNGGGTETLLPATTSPAVGIVPPGSTLSAIAVCPATDQRGVVRPLSGSTDCSSGAVEPATPPGAPTIGTATAGNGQATVTFSPPATTGGVAIASYAVAATDSTTPANGGQTATAASSPITVAGLTNGDTYSFTVTATSFAPGPPSAPSNAVSPAPTITAVTFGGDAVTPTVTVTGSGFGTEGSLGTPQTPCGPPSTGFDFGNNLSLADTTAGWSAGQVVAGVCDYVGLSISSYTNARIVFTFGSTYPTYGSLAVGDAFTVSVLGGTSAGTVAYRPTVTSVSPTVLDAGGSTTLTVTGSGFVSGATVGITGPSTDVKASNVTVATGGTSLTTAVAAGAGAAVGSYSVRVTAPDHASGTCSHCLAIGPAPTLAGTAPTQVAVGANVTLTLTGTGFEPGATVTLGGPSPLSLGPTAITATAITAALSVPTTTTTGSYAVTVTDPDHTSATGVVLSVIAAPTLSSVTPKVHKTHLPSGSVTITVTGTGFAHGAQLYSSHGISFSAVTVVDPTTITATLVWKKWASIGTHPLTVHNDAAGGSGTATASILVIY